VNLINPQLPELKEGEWFAISQFRHVDFEKIPKFINNMYENIKRIDSEFNYEITYENQTSPYLEDGATFYKRLTVSQEYKDQKNKISVLIPRLLNDNFFLLNGSYYVPLLFLEKAPIDRILNKEANKNKIFINLNAVYNFTFDFVKGMVQFRSKKISLDIFLRIFFRDDKEYLKQLQKEGLITKDTYTKEEYKKFVKNFFDFYKWNFFDTIDIIEWLDQFLLLDYYRNIFKDYYGIDNLKDIIKKVITFYLEDIEIDMATLGNRRVVLVEYLIRPLFEIYVRLLYGIVDKKGQKYLPTINEFAVLTSGFSGLLHRGQIYDISNPYPLPLINKVSQDIQIIKNGRLPKSWQRNDKSGYGVICPISVSPQNMGTNLVFTTSARINQFGRIKKSELKMFENSN
jgi:DNA-directed RNA polymerase beta subunit